MLPSTPLALKVTTIVYNPPSFRNSWIRPCALNPSTLDVKWKGPLGVRNLATNFQFFAVSNYPFTKDGKKRRKLD